MINAVLRLRRDNDYNYAKIKDSFIPANGEICLVDTATDGLRAVCGNGTTSFGQLKFIDSLIEKGIINGQKFYTDNTLSEELQGVSHKIYVDLKDNKLYHFDENQFKQLCVISAASAEQAGIMKLYDEVGQNTDGTMTQKAITDNLNKKVEISLEEETVVFSNFLF